MKIIPAIVGLTASGKSIVGVDVALELNGEIISADSRQVYKDMNIAVSVPDVSERRDIVHHFIEILDPSNDYNAGEFGKDGRKLIEEILSRKKIPVIVGGSGLYLKSLIDGFYEEEIKDKNIREKLNNDLKEKGSEFLHSQLKKVDNESAEKIPPSMSRRIIRALEVYYASGEKISELQKRNVMVDFETMQFAIDWERELLYDRINKRVDMMIEKGLVYEVKQLIKRGYHYNTHNSLNTVGVKEVIMFLENEISITEMIELIKRNTRRFAKRQMTWFRKDKRINWIKINSPLEFNKIVKKIVNDYKKKAGLS